MSSTSDRVPTVKAASSVEAGFVHRAFLDACRAELEALKPGNVHVHSDGHGMTVRDFLDSAEAAARPISEPGWPVGARIRAAIEASWAAVPRNTNLGIVLLAAPLAVAAEHAGNGLRAQLGRVLGELTVADASEAFAAIRCANPAGLGQANEQDVGTEPTATLLEAMRLAAQRDLIARQYATGYADVYATGVARIDESRRLGRSPTWTTTLVFLDFLARFRDSHITRKFDAETAEWVRVEAERLCRSLPDDRNAALPALMAFDHILKRRGLNPGTSADLTVASLLAAKLGDKLTTTLSDIG